MSLQAPLPPVRTSFFEPDPQNQGNTRISWPWVQWFLQIESFRTQFKGSYLQDTHANRLANYPASNSAAATEFLETDRHVFYISSGTAWLYQSGVMLAPAANRPIDLGANDTGFAFIATDTGLMSTWNGIAWINPIAALPAIIDALTFTLQLRRGLKAALPAVMASGEAYYATDTFELYFGTGAGIHKAETDANSIQGVTVNPQAPGNGQLLIYDAPTASYVPGDPIVSGTAGDGSVPVGNPVRVGGTGIDGKVHTFQTDPLGVISEDARVIKLLEQIVLELRTNNLLLAQMKEPGNSSQYPNLTDSVGTLQ